MYASLSAGQSASMTERAQLETILLALRVDQAHPARQLAPHFSAATRCAWLAAAELSSAVVTAPDRQAERLCLCSPVAFLRRHGYGGHGKQRKL